LELSKMTLEQKAERAAALIANALRRKRLSS